MSKHTPGPWKLGAVGWIVHQPTADIRVAMTAGFDFEPTTEEAEANAEFIVRACNAHDQLLEALKTLLARGWCDFPSVTQAARAAIAKAEGKP